MKVGDLVKYKNLHGHVVDGKFISKDWVGIVVEVGGYPGHKNIRVMWKHGLELENSSGLEVISENKEG